MFLLTSLSAIELNPGEVKFAAMTGRSGELQTTALAARVRG